VSTTAHEPTRTSSSVPQALVWLSVLLGVAGLVVSGYLTYEHYSASTTLACPDTGRINCARVTSSRYSELAGVPVAALGTLYFIGFLPLLAPIAWRATQSWVRTSRVVMAGLGVAMVLYLLWAEFYGVGAICLWCTAVHGITFLLFVTIVFAEAMRDSDPSMR
jgi:uncharacterized membrane protein